MELVDYVASELHIATKDMLEKDIMLHRILVTLLEDSLVMEQFVFKGGTCLTKCYLGYYRFSEDLDFSYKNQKEFAGKSQKEIRKILSAKIDYLLGLFAASAKKCHLISRRSFYIHLPSVRQNHYLQALTQSPLHFCFRMLLCF